MASATSSKLSTTDTTALPNFPCHERVQAADRQKSNPVLLLQPSDDAASRASEVLPSYFSQSLGPSAPNNSPATGVQSSKRTAISPSISRFYASLTNVFHAGSNAALGTLHGEPNAQDNTQPVHDTDSGAKVCHGGNHL